MDDLVDARREYVALPGPVVFGYDSVGMPMIDGATGWSDEDTKKLAAWFNAVRNPAARGLMNGLDECPEFVLPEHCGQCGGAEDGHNDSAEDQALAADIDYCAKFEQCQLCEYCGQKHKEGG